MVILRDGHPERTVILPAVEDPPPTSLTQRARRDAHAGLHSDTDQPTASLRRRSNSSTESLRAWMRVFRRLICSPILVGVTA
jgi:hypothetical protein